MNRTKNSVRVRRSETSICHIYLSGVWFWSGHWTTRKKYPLLHCLSEQEFDLRKFSHCLMPQYPWWCQWLKVRIWSMLTISSQCFHANKWCYEAELKSPVDVGIQSWPQVKLLVLCHTDKPLMLDSGTQCAYTLQIVLASLQTSQGIPQCMTSLWMSDLNGMAA